MIEKRIEELANDKDYAENVHKAECFIGIKSQTALAVIAETGDFNRFPDAQHYASLTEYEHATWSREANLNMWKLYLDGREASTLPYAVPMLMENYENFPPVYIEPSEMDTLRDQAIAYAEKMRTHGVDVTETVIEGAYHGFDGNMDSELVKRTLVARVNWLKTIEKGAQN